MSKEEKFISQGLYQIRMGCCSLRWVRETEFRKKVEPMGIDATSVINKGCIGIHLKANGAFELLYKTGTV